MYIRIHDEQQRYLLVAKATTTSDGRNGVVSNLQLSASIAFRGLTLFLYFTSNATLTAMPSRHGHST